MNKENIIKELTFKAVRSSGAGGQHVNKVSSKVELYFNVTDSNILSSEEKVILLEKLANRLTKENTLILAADDSRSQHRNKEIVTKRFLDLLKESLKIPKNRRPTKPSRTAVKKRLDNKQKRAVKKILRKKPKIE